MTKAVPAALLFAACPVIADHASPKQMSPQVLIRMFNISSLPAEEVFAAEQRVTRIFATAKIAVKWEEGNPGDDAATLVDFSAPRICSSPSGSNIVPVRIVQHAPPGLSAAALAHALPCAQTGIRVTVFWDRLQRAMGGVATRPGDALGSVIAHEIGHVLMRSLNHASNGLMRAAWRRDEWNAIANGTLTFTAMEARQLMGRLQHQLNTDTHRN